jgi:hypothetical protein
LHTHPYKVTVVPEIKPVHYEKRVRFCNWFIAHVHEGLLDPKLAFVTDEANLLSWDMSPHKITHTGVVKIVIP